MNIKKLIPIVIGSLSVFMLVGCDNKVSTKIGDKSKTSIKERTSKEVSDNDKITSTEIIEENFSGKDDFIIDIYTDKNSSEYKELGNDSISLGECYDNVENGSIRFVCNTDGVKVSLEAISYYDTVTCFRPYMTIFETEVEKDKVYEFGATMVEGLPSYRLVATKGDSSMSWFVQSDGINDEKVIEIYGVETGIVEPYEGDYITSLCRIYALESNRAGDDISKMPEYFWNTVAKAVTYISSSNSDADEEGNFYLEEWLMNSYIDSLFSTMDYCPDIKESDQVEYTPDRFERYTVHSDYPDIDSNTGFVESEMISEDTAKLLISVNNSVLYEFELKSVFFSENPLDWIITGVKKIDSVG